MGTLDADFNILEKGNKVTFIFLEDSGDDHLIAWAEKYGNGKMTISDIEPESELVWVSGCPFAISAAYVRKASER